MRSPKTEQLLLKPGPRLVNIDMSDQKDDCPMPEVIRFIEDADTEEEAAKYFQNRLIQLLSNGSPRFLGFLL